MKKYRRVRAVDHPVVGGQREADPLLDAERAVGVDQGHHQIDLGVVLAVQQVVVDGADQRRHIVGQMGGVGHANTPSDNRFSISSPDLERLLTR